MYLSTHRTVGERYVFLFISIMLAVMGSISFFVNYEILVYILAKKVIT